MVEVPGGVAAREKHGNIMSYAKHIEMIEAKSPEHKTHRNVEGVSSFIGFITVMLNIKEKESTDHWLSCRLHARSTLTWGSVQHFYDSSLSVSFSGKFWRQKL